MPFDPSQPFEVVESDSGFDPSKPFEVAGSGASGNWGPRVEPSRLKRVVGNVVRGAGNVAGSMLEGMDVAPTPVEEMEDLVTALFPSLKRPEGQRDTTPIQERIGYKAGQRVRSASNTFGGEAPEGTGRIERFLTDTLPSGAGSMAAFVGAGILTRGAGVRGAAAVALPGALAGTGEGFTDAKDHGADDETAMFSALLNAGLGATEAVPLAKWLTRTGGTKAFRTALVEGSEEALQEFVQQVGSNIVAEQLYDPSRPWLQGAGEGAAAGATLGTLGSLLASALGKARSRGAAQPPKPVVPVKPPQEADPESDLQIVSPADIEKLETVVAQTTEQAQQTTAPEPIQGIAEAVAAANAPQDIDFSPFDTSGGEATPVVEDSQSEATDESGVVAPEPQLAAAVDAGVVDPEAPLDLETTPPSAPALGPDLGAGAAAETPSVQEPINAPAESASLTPRNPQPNVLPAGPGAETITGSNERRGSEMPAEVGSIPAPKPGPARSSARTPATDRPPDLLDDIEGQVGSIDPTLIQEANPDWRPTGAARKLFRRGGVPADSALAALAGASANIQADLPIDQFGEAINAAARGRQAGRKTAAAQKREAETLGKQRTQFEKKAIQGERPKGTEDPTPVAVENLFVGDTFEVQGFNFQVTDAEFDEDGRAISITVKDGPKFGVQVVDGAEVIQIDSNSYRPRPQLDDGFGEQPPAQPPAANSGNSGWPPGFFDKPESIEEQKAREANEKAAREAKGAKDKLAELAAKPLKGTSGDLGQGDLLESPEDLFAPPTPAPKRAPEPKPEPKAFGSDNKLVTTAQAEELRKRLRTKLGRTNVGVDPTIFTDSVQLGVYYLEGGVRAFPEWSARMIEDLGDAIRPLLRSVYEGARAFPGADYEDDMDPPKRVKELASQYVAGTNPLVERAGPGAGQPSGQSGGRDVLDAQPGQAGAAPGQLGAGSEQADPGPSGGQLYRGDLPDDAGQPGDSGVRRPAGTRGPSSVSGGRGGRGAGGGPDESRALAESQSDLGPSGSPKPAPDAPSVVESAGGSDAARIAAQAAVEGRVVWKGADPENIAASLPALLPAQREDVLKAERRFMEAPREPQGSSGMLLGDPKRGILFTNGTGTGKTYTGLGIIKRFAMQGKTSTLIVVPNQSNVGNWVSESRFLNLPVAALRDTSSAGVGTVVTTYANLRNNDTLLNRDWDLVVMDESHHILSNEAGDFTAGINAFRMNANHPDALKFKATRKVLGPPPSKAEFDSKQKLQEAQSEYSRRYREREAEINAEVDRLRKIDTRAVFLSATPFAYHKSLQLVDGYLFSLPNTANRSQAYNEPAGFDRFMVENLGYRMRTGKLTQPDVGVRVDLMEMTLADSMLKQGAMSGRSIDVPFDYSREFVVIDSDLAQTMDDGWSLMRGMEGYRQFPTLAQAYNKLWDYNNTAQLLEALKMDAAIPRIREHLAMGRKIILFHSYIQGEIKAHPFRFDRYPLEASPFSLNGRSDTDKEIDAFTEAHPELVNMEMPSMERSLEKLKAAFGDTAVFFNGTVPKRKRQEAIVDFMRDGGKAGLFVAQLQAGKEGISLHDKTGRHQRVVMMAALPNRPTDATQAEGRAYRIGVQSNAIYEYLALHSSMERFQFASRINEKVSTVETLARGTEARNLRERFKDLYLNAGTEAPSPQQGVGGKQADRRHQTVSDFERAISYYFGRMKKNSRSKSAEGVDYFATPEPLGLKMVEWAQPRVTEDLLEPSAGHGAIGRWFPINTSQTFIEPSGELRSELSIKVNGGRVVAGRFEDLDIVNKYDVIVMNPPFGQGGATAMRHLAKAAWEHLRDGGRIVALIPEGPMADRAFERFMEDPKSKHVYLRRTFGLPQSVFERAGTSVKTRVVILDKSVKMPLEDSGRVDLVGDQDINEFIATIRDKSAPERTRKESLQVAPLQSRDAVLPATVPVADQATSPVPRPGPLLLEGAATKHTRTGAPLWVAKTTRRVSRDRYEEMAAAAKRRGGYWSSYAKGGAIPGFQFDSQAARDAFLEEQNALVGDPSVYRMMLFPQPPNDPATEETRRFMYQVAEEPLVSDLAKRKIANAIYGRRTNAEDSKEAARLIDEAGGPIQAMVVWRDPNSGIPSMVRMLMAQAIIKRLGVVQQAATAAGKAKEAEQMAGLQAQFIDEMTNEITDAAQALQSLRAFHSMTPEGMVQKYRRAVNDARAGIREGMDPQIQDAVEELNSANDGALGDLQADPEAQDATRKAIDQAIQESPKVREAIRVVVAGAFGDSTVIQEGVRKIVTDAFNRTERTPRQRSLWQQYRAAAAKALARLPGAPAPRAALDEFTRRIMGTLRAQIARVAPPVQGMPQNLPPLEQMLEAFANPEKYQQVWLDTIERLREQYPGDPRVDILATQPAALVSEGAMRQALREELAQADVSLGELLGRGYIVNDGRILSERIQSVLGWMGLEATPEQSLELARTADREWTKMVQAEAARVAGRVNQARVREARAIRAARSGLAEVDAIPESEIDTVVRQQLRESRLKIGQILRGHWKEAIGAGINLARKLETAGLTPQVANALGARIQQRFADLVKARKAHAIERIRNRAPRSLRRREMWEKLVEQSNLGALSDEGAWNVLAKELNLPVFSPATAARVVTLSNEIQRVPEGFQRDRKVRDLLDFIVTESGVTTGSLLMSLWYARLLSGPTTHVLNVLSNLQQLGVSYTLLAARRPGDARVLARALWNGLVKALPEMQEVLTSGKVTGVRMLKAEPSGALELAPNRGVWKLLKHWRMVGRLMAAEDMAVFFPIHEARQMALARELARRQGLKGVELEAEVERIMGSSEDAVRAAQAKARAEGLSGMDLRRRVNELIDSARPEDLRQDAMEYALRYTFNSKPYGVLGVLAGHMRAFLGQFPAGRLVVPFVNVVANVANEAINYSPLVGWRLWKAYRNGEVAGHQAAYNEVFELTAKAAVGITLTSMLAAIVAAGWDEDEDKRFFDLSGPGPASYEQRRQLMMTGWRPFSLRLGNRWVNYTDTPLSVVLGAMGTYLDAVRFRRLNEKGMLAKIGFALKGMIQVTVNRSMLQGIADLFTAIMKEGVESDEAWARSMARPLGSMLTSRLVSQVDRMLAPTVTESSTVDAALLAQVPFARRLGKPALNAFGEPVDAGPWERFVSGVREDRLARVLAEKRAWVPMQTEAELGGRRGAFTAEERYRFIQERGPALRAHLERLLPRLETLDSEQAREMVSRVAEIHTARTKARIVAERQSP